MRDHFGAATQVRDAVLRGKVEPAQSPLIWLGQHGYARQVPANWRPHLERMQQAARKAIDEPTLQGVARQVGSMAAACGACHAALGQGPRFEPSGLTDLEEAQTDRAALQGRMHAHFWAAERMWEGLVGPWDAAWQEGATALRELTVAKQGAELELGLEQIRALGAQAVSTSGETRAVLYGQVIAQCGSCHAARAPGAF